MFFYSVHIIVRACVWIHDTFFSYYVFLLWNIAKYIYIYNFHIYRSFEITQKKTLSWPCSYFFLSLSFFSSKNTYKLNSILGWLYLLKNFIRKGGRMVGMVQSFKHYQKSYRFKRKPILESPSPFPRFSFFIPFSAYLMNFFYLKVSNTRDGLFLYISLMTPLTYFRVMLVNNESMLL